MEHLCAEFYLKNCAQHAERLKRLASDPQALSFDFGAAGSRFLPSMVSDLHVPTLSACDLINLEHPRRMQPSSGFMLRSQDPTRTQ